MLTRPGTHSALRRLFESAIEPFDERLSTSFARLHASTQTAQRQFGRLSVGKLNNLELKPRLCKASSGWSLVLVGEWSAVRLLNFRHSHCIGKPSKHRKQRRTTAARRRPANLAKHHHIFYRPILSSDLSVLIGTGRL